VGNELCKALFLLCAHVERNMSAWKVRNEWREAKATRWKIVTATHGQQSAMTDPGHAEMAGVIGTYVHYQVVRHKRGLGKNI
jgi:hypothetical protein